MKSTLRRGLACILPVVLASSFSGCTSEYQGVDLFPIYRDVGDEKAGEFFWLLPPVWKSWNGDESLSWSLPFHLHQTKGEHDELTLIPLIPVWYQQKTLDVETRAIFPLWQRETAGVQNVTKILLGLGGYTTMDDEPGLRSLTVAPLFGFAKTPGGTNLEFVTTGDILTGKGGKNALLSGVALDRSVPYFGEEDRPGLAIDVLNVFGGLALNVSTSDLRADKPAPSKKAIASTSTGKGSKNTRKAAGSGAGGGSGNAKLLTQLPRAISSPAPAYPMAARAQKAQGTTTVRVTVDESGHVTTCSIHNSSGNDTLDRAALSAVKRWRFAPGLRASVPIEADVLVRVVFRLA